MRDDDQAVTTDGQGRWALALPVLLVVTALAYAPALGAGFAWDDIPLVVQNRVLGEPGAVPRLFSQSLWESSSVGAEDNPVHYYRPLMMLSLWVDRQLFGLAPWGYHLHSVLWHLLAVAASWTLARPLLGVRGAALATLCFALHPVQSESVVWVAARNDPMAAAFGLWALVAVSREGTGRMVLAGGLTLCAGLTKESVILLPVLLGLLQLARGRLQWRAWLPILGGIGLALAARGLAGVPRGAMLDPTNLLFLAARLHQVLGILGASLVFPWPLSGARSLEWAWLEPTWRVVLGLGVWVGLGLAAALAWGERARVIRVGLLWAVLCIAPVLPPIASTGQLGERYLYLPMVGISWALGAGLGRVGVPALIGLALPWMLILGLRIGDWQDDRSLWTAAVRDVPSPMAWGGLAHIDRQDGNNEQALRGFMAALDHEVPDLSVCTEVVGTAIALGDPRMAVDLGAWTEKRLCNESPERGEWLGQRAVAHTMVGDWEGARALLAGAPEDPTRRADVVRAALALHDGDSATYARIESAWDDPDSLARQAGGLVERGEAASRQLDMLPP